MNRGLLGISAQRWLGAVGVYRSPQLPQASGQYNEINQPFPLQAIAQSVLYCIAPYGGFKVGDQWHQPNWGGNSTVNTIDYALYRCDGRKIATKNGAGGAGSSRAQQGIDGTQTYVPVASFNEIIVALGPVTEDMAGIPGVSPAQRFTTPPRLCALSANIVERNLLGRYPAFVNALLQCRYAEAGYKVGDCIELFSYQASGASVFPRPAIRATPSIVELRTPTTLVFPHADTGASTTGTAGNWNIYMEVIG